MNEYKFTCDIWGYEPGIGVAPIVMEGLTAEYFEAADDEAAKVYAERFIAKYAWTEWKSDKGGWERYRTAKKFDASWMRVERVTVQNK